MDGAVKRLMSGGHSRPHGVRCCAQYASDEEETDVVRYRPAQPMFRSKRSLERHHKGTIIRSRSAVLMSSSFVGHVSPQAGSRATCHSDKTSCTVLWQGVSLGVIVA